MYSCLFANLLIYKATQPIFIKCRYVPGSGQGAGIQWKQGGGDSCPRGAYLQARAS